MTEPPTHDELVARLAEAEQTLDAIRRGEVDALVVSGPDGPQVYTLEGADAFYRVLIEQMPVGAAAVQRDGSVLYANGTFADMLGVPLEALIGAHLAGFTDGEARRLLDRALAAGAGDREVDLVMAGRQVALSARQLADATCVVAVDLTQRLEAELATREAEERFRGAFDNAPIGMALLDLDGVTERVNSALCTILGRPADELLGTRLPWFGHDLATVLDNLAREEVPQVTLERGGDNGLAWVALHLSAVHGPGTEVRHFIVQVQDISERRNHEERLRYVADHDGLTGLLNRRGFETAMNEHLALASRYGGGGALVLLDVDHFKYINDARGHQAGDRVLMSLAQSLAGRLRESDVVARIGGDEFAILLPRADAGTARLVADEIVTAARGVQAAELVGLRKLTVSVGVAVVDDTERSVGELMALADLAMYDAKEAGRDQVAIYDPSAEEGGSETEHRMTWLRRIRDVLDAGAFELFAQPIIDLANDRVVQRELLVRMPAQAGVAVPAGVWFDVAERYDLATDIDEWVFERALELLRAGDGREGLNINISAMSIGRPSLMRRVRAGLSAGGFPPGRLTFEITETAAIGNIAAAARFVEELHVLGCRLALDDFGAGFGSFYYLKHLPFDDIKIDGEFVRNSVNDPRDQSIIRAMVDVARSMGRRTVAEAIEDADTLELMRVHGVDLAQGYHLGRPAPV